MLSADLYAHASEDFIACARLRLAAWNNRLAQHLPDRRRYDTRVEGVAQVISSQERLCECDEQKPRSHWWNDSLRNEAAMPLQAMRCWTYAASFVLNAL
jgi:hypothetical protein